MQSKPSQPEEEGQLKSTFQETMQALDSRINIIRGKHFSLENELLKCTELNPKSISDIVTDLGIYSLMESPVQPSLLDLYTNQVQGGIRCVLPPPSQGEDSVNQVREFQPSFDWVCKAVIDSTMLTLDQLEPKKTEKGKVPPEWIGVSEVLIHNINKKIYYKDEVRSISKYLSASFEKYPWVKVKRIREVYYKGKPSVIIRFSDDYGCSFAYFNLCRLENNRKENLGDNSEVYRVINNKLKPSQNQKWVALLFRRLPLSLTKQVFLDTLRRKKIQPIWMQDLIQIQNYKYTLARVGCLDEAFELCSIFQINPPMKDICVNLHPRSCKIWRELQIRQGVIQQNNEVYPGVKKQKGILG